MSEKDLAQNPHLNPLPVGEEGKHRLGSASLSHRERRSPFSEASGGNPPSLQHSITPPPLPWFSGFPLFLAPMAGVSDKIFRQLCKEYGADVLTTEFVSAEGIFRRNERTREYLDFDEIERPDRSATFRGNADHLAEAARHVVDWVGPDFIDLNFGCPVNKVVSKNGGSALLKDCPTMAAVAGAVVRAAAPLPVTAKIRIGWDADSVNAVRVGQILVDEGIAAMTVHGRTRAQGYSGSADWNVIGEVAASVAIPVIGNGDLVTPRMSPGGGNRLLLPAP